MAEIEHPHIDPVVQLATEGSIERDMADEAIEIISLYGFRVTSVESDYEVAQPTTERVDINGGPGDTDHSALRLRSVSVLTIDTPGETAKRDAPIVLGLDVGKVACSTLETTDLQQLADPDFDWQSYILIVIDSRTCEADILSGQTGQPLSFDGTMQAHNTLQFVHQTLRFIRNEEIVQDNDNSIRAVIQPLVVEEEHSAALGDSFDPDEVIIMHQAGPEGVPGYHDDRTWQN